MASHRSASVKLTVVPILAAAFLASGCGEEEEQAYCVDDTDTVVQNEQCDEEYDRGSGVGGGGFFWLFVGGGRGFGLGNRVTGGGERIRASDRASLARRGGFGQRARSGGVGRGTGAFSSGG